MGHWGEGAGGRFEVKPRTFHLAPFTSNLISCAIHTFFVIVLTYLPFLKGFFRSYGPYWPYGYKVSAFILSLSELPVAVELVISGQGYCPQQFKVVVRDNREEFDV